MQERAESFARLKELKRECGEQAFQKIIRTLTSQLKNDLKHLKNLHLGHEQKREILHRIKGMALNFGFNSLVQMSQGTEGRRT